MTKTITIIRAMDYFFVDIFEKQKELDTRIYAQSQPRNLFKKKDYQANIDEYKKLKNLALKINPSGYDPDPEDEDLLELIVSFEEVLAVYNMYCDRGIAVQELLRRKAEGDKYKHSLYSEAADKQRAAAALFQTKMNDFNAEYSEYKEMMAEEV